MPKRNMFHTSSCVMCSQHPLETALHLFFLCPYALRIWDTLSSSAGFPVLHVADSSLLTYLSSIPRNKDCRQKWLTDFITATALIWRERNARIFASKATPAVILATRNRGEIDSTITGKEDENEMVVSRRWDELPIELVEMLFPRLSLVDCLRLPSVCKGWSKASSSIRKGRVWPWLMHLPNLKYGSCKFFDPLYCEEYTLKSDAVVAARDRLVLRFSKDGWVVVTEGNKRIFVLNPFTAQVFNLPPQMEDYIFDGIYFVSVPTSPDFVVYGFFFQMCGEFVEISSWRPGQEEWTVLRFGPSIPFFPSSNNPVLFRGKFYCLGRKGELGVFNPEAETWNVLGKPAPIHSVKPPYGNEYCHLLELNEHLISVFRTDDAKSPIRVFKLNQSAMVWENVELLGDMILFIDHRNSIAIPSPKKEYANRIYVPRFEGSSDFKKGIFYSMEDNKYHPTMHKVEEPVSCVWMEPCLQICK